ncbi:DUF4168 domain-containing protein [Catalinimonas niigatensis]|uniref:DUF4168 domain-containing protein n=1 Tax=Catalinimonas niigatensis TaxID=1397264 RepID=UPI0026667636|nr:DUF4168 domain-containing protein [Catalinimonas niigatensis]WPP50363.1 DUF4168 domain-containing protein [Catalinimonas niigatensis]
MKSLRFWIAPLALFIFVGCQESGKDSAQEGDATQDMQQAPEMDDLQMEQSPQASNISEEELEKFVDIDMQLQPMQQQAQQEMIAKVEEKGMAVEKFQEIAQSQQQGDSTAFSSEELQNFNEINEDLSEIDSQLREEVQTKIEEEGVSIERYQEIAMAVNQDPSLQQKLQEIYQRKAGEQNSMN